MGLGQKLQFATRRNKTNQIRIRKRELDASNNRSFASEIVSSYYEVTALVLTVNLQLEVGRHWAESGLVDPDTGKVTILRFTIVQDAGKAIHPSYVEGQMQGAVAQGIGWALNEEYYMGDQDQMVNSSFLDYRMPTSLDLPMIDTVIVEVANPGHPYGVRGVGEVPIVPPMAAVANAIADALKLRLTEMPMSPGAVLEAIWSNNGEVVQAADD